MIIITSWGTIIVVTKIISKNLDSEIEIRDHLYIPDLSVDFGITAVVVVRSARVRYRWKVAVEANTTRYCPMKKTVVLM